MKRRKFFTSIGAGAIGLSLYQMGMAQQLISAATTDVL